VPSAGDTVTGSNTELNTGLARFRADVASWFAEHTPRDWRAELDGLDEAGARQFHLRWLHTLNQRGFAACAVPAEWGGGGYRAAEQVVIYEEWAAADGPNLDLFLVSLHHVPATLMIAGTEEQQRRYLADAIAGTVWCQGFSEPGAGSDLSNLRTRADQVDGGWRINGSKIWSTNASAARYCLLLARTDPNTLGGRGITYFILDMDQPGVVVRPIRQNTGHAEFAEIFLEDAFVPAENLLGQVGAGWAVAQATLAEERGPAGFDTLARIGVGLRQVGEQMLDPADRAELARLSARHHMVRSLALDLVDTIERGDHTGLAASLLKVAFSELLGEFTEFAGRVGGVDSLVDPGQRHSRGFVSGDWTIDWLGHWGWTISAGANEVQRNIIAEKLLGMPREPRPAPARRGTS
jgi:alkylation response protein AidB-like acyl-CoA dehydrogenase